MRYELEKYRGMSSRYTCPRCDKKKVFTKYVDTDTKTYVGDDVGKCSRLIKCGYHKSPKDMLGEGYSFERSSLPRTDSVKKLCTINSDYVARSVGIDSMFGDFLKNRFEEKDIECIMLRYYLGRTRDRGVIFWQIDSNMRVRTGKIMYYDVDSGKRLKRRIDWVHSLLSRVGRIGEDWELSQCLFGEHLLSDSRFSDSVQVGIVESEKSALIATIYMPDMLWLASGGLQNLSCDRMRCLQGRRVLVFPDTDSTDIWAKKIYYINKELHTDFRVSYMLSNLVSKDNKFRGYDLADYLLDL